MENKTLKIITGVLVLIWMICVFWFSNEPSTESQNTSGEFTQKIVNIISEIFNIQNDEETVQKLNPYIRKYAHYLLYTIGGIFIIISVRQYENLSNKKQIIISLIIGLIYSISDEIHQYFVPGRSCQIRDVFIDFLGVGTGVVLVLLIIKLYENIKYSKDRGECTMNVTDETIKAAPSKHVNLGRKILNIKNIINKVIKRFIDIIAGIVGCILLIPICFVVFIINLISGDHGPMFFVQERIGKNGKLFKMYKFRTMVENAEEILQDCINSSEETREEYQKYKKLKDDPRITKIGKFMRKTSLDEFPQFLNILKGEMSLVGPRPYLLREKEEMGKYYDYIIKCKPGLTGLWQIAGRTNVNFKTRLRLDYKYFRENNLIYDIKILLNTFIITFTGKGAM